ncbi:hypothetical protein HHL22_03155 [Hymenobacter sp. RP-2-7]|uniref:DUF3298 domain-containing protein n=1 Tax=Hymenobacter polaris TaxID=2682546 RepID=A0A7Y0ABA7_9BACT|nr:RsiV family protein [Hymenobacter polaris]NML64195.1 hypothetical protein [Hymenobacter polaris]
MKNLYRALLAGALPLLAGCHAEPGNTTATPPAHPPQAAVPRATAPTAAPVAAAPPFTGYHRYRGRVGGRPVTVVLTIDSTEAYHGKKLACTGSYYYGQATGGLLNLAAKGTYQPQQPLQLRESASARATGTWQATQPAGPLLSGTWTSPAGKQLPFELREDYTDGRGHLMAVRYEVLGESVVLPCQLEHYEEETKEEYRTRLENAPNGYDLPFLHLLGPDTLRRSLGALQCPVPRERRQLVRAQAKENGCNYHSESLQVDYNDYGLLAWSGAWTDEYEGGARPGHGQSATVYDLRTGHVSTMADVFRTGADALLQRLITQHILHDDNPDLTPTPGLAVPARADNLAPLPSDFSLEENGIAFLYNIDELAQLTDGGAIILSVPVPYRELQPLLRPTSPVARMLRERGLWRGQ